MSALSPVLRAAEGGRLTFWCPGCKESHAIEHGNGRWSWNGNVDKPTFTPSILVQYDHWMPPAVPGQPAPASQTQVHDVCHSFVTDGRIQFLNDCTHALAGQTVDLPAWD